LVDQVVGSIVITVSNGNRVLEHIVSVLFVVFDDVSSEIVDSSAGLYVSGVSGKESKRFIAAAAVRIFFGFLEEGKADSVGSAAHVTIAALDFGNAVGVLADQLALGLGAGWLVAFPVALGLFADDFAFKFWSLTMGDAVRSLADCHALGTVE